MAAYGDRLQEALEQTGQAHGPGLFGLVTEAGHEVFAGATGRATLHDERPIDASDRLRIGSITKTFVTVLALQLLDDGAFGWDDSVERWLPGMVPDGERTTVGHLLRMRSGLPDYNDQTLGTPLDFAQLQRYWSPESLVSAALTSTDRIPIDSVFRYCNTDYILLGLIIERATGQRVDAQMCQRVLVPADLVDTTFPVVDPQLPQPHADGHLRMTPEEPHVECTTMSPSEAWTAGAIVSTPHDLAKFLDALFDGSLLSSDSLARMTACEERVHDTRWRGLGIDRRLLPNGQYILGHHGGVPGFTSMAVRTESGRNIVLYQNGIELYDCMNFDTPFIVAAAAD
jgi:D-alanyl-D-alanine carboxypeptidase